MKKTIYDLGQPELELAKAISHAVWEKYDDDHGYRSQKQQLNDEMPTDKPENIWFFWQQFDSQNQREFYMRLAASEQPAAIKLLPWTTDQYLRMQDAVERLKKVGIIL